jgi:hypothetical protein
MKIRKKKHPVELLEDFYGVETESEEYERWERRVNEDTLYEVKKARKVRAAICREDINEFCIFVGKDRETGLPFDQATIHENFHDLADRYDRLIVMAHPDSGKTTQLGIMRILHTLGNDPSKLIAVVSKNADNSVKITRATKEIIEKSEELAEVFPSLLPGGMWTESKFVVRRHIPGIKDPSVQALGIGGSIIGSRVDLLVLDDVLDLENTMSSMERKKTIRRITESYINRLSRTGKVIFLTNAWHPDDAAHYFEKESKKGNSRWHVARFPVIYDNGELSWPEHWDHKRIEAVRGELTPIEFARSYLCKARDDSESPFDRESIERSMDIADKEEIDLAYAVNVNDCIDYVIYHGVDLAFTKNDGSHLTAIVTVGLDLVTQKRQLMWCESGRWSSAEIRDRILDHYRRYGGSFVVENVAAQRWIIDIVQNQYDLPIAKRVGFIVIPFTTGRNKSHPQHGVEGLSVEISNDLWLIPVTGPEMARKEAIELIGEMLYYSRGAHTGDRLMGLWFAREGCRRGAFAGKPEREGIGCHASSGGNIGKDSSVKIIGDKNLIN